MRPNKKSRAIESEIETGCAVIEAGDIGMEFAKAWWVFFFDLADDIFNCVVELLLDGEKSAMCHKGTWMFICLLALGF